MTTRVKHLLFGIVAMGLSLVAVAAASEIVFRALLFGKAPFMERFRKPELYADASSDDDYWKLLYRFGGQHLAPKEPHPLLGWTLLADFSPQTYEHKDAPKIGKRRPVLLYGDSFAYYVKYRDDSFHSILNADPEFGADYFLLNYGVGGYGLDQIFLLFQKTVDLYAHPVVVMSFMTDDIDRCVLSVRGGQKPYFVLDRGKLVLKGVPIDPDPASYFAKHPPGVFSYLARMALYSRLLPAGPAAFLRGDERKQASKIDVARAILEHISADLSARGIDCLFLVFHPRWTGDILQRDNFDWREEFSLDFLREKGLPFLSTREIVREDAERTGKKFDDYFLAGDGHPTPYQNRIVSEKIKSAVLAMRR